MNRLFTIGLLALAALLAACNEQQQQQQGAAPAGSAQPAALADDDLPTQADFDDEAEKQITPASYKSELDSLEKEINTQ